MRTRFRRRMTLLQLVQEIQRSGRSEEDVVKSVIRLVNSGRVTLRGNFAGRRF
jgi:hypothetical protein